MISDCLNGVLARYLVIKKDDRVTVEFIYSIYHGSKSDKVTVEFIYLIYHMEASLSDVKQYWRCSGCRRVSWWYAPASEKNEWALYLFDSLFSVVCLFMFKKGGKKADILIFYENCKRNV